MARSRQPLTRSDRIVHCKIRTRSMLNLGNHNYYMWQTTYANKYRNHSLCHYSSSIRLYRKLSCPQIVRSNSCARPSISLCELLVSPWEGQLWLHRNLTKIILQNNVLILIVREGKHCFQIEICAMTHC